MEKKTNYLQLRLTPSQFEDIKRRYPPFGTMSNFVIQALKEFSNASAKEKIDVAKQLANSFVTIDNKLAHVGGNINQAMKRVNERRVAGIEYDSLLLTTLLPELHSCMELCNELRKEIRDITYKYAK